MIEVTRFRPQVAQPPSGTTGCAYHPAITSYTSTKTRLAARSKEDSHTNSMEKEVGAEDGIRTHDPLLGKEMLYH